MRNIAQKTNKLEINSCTVALKQISYSLKLVGEAFLS